MRDNKKGLLQNSLSLKADPQEKPEQLFLRVGSSCCVRFLCELLLQFHFAARPFLRLFLIHYYRDQLDPLK